MTGIIILIVILSIAAGAVVQLLQGEHAPREQYSLTSRPPVEGPHGGALV